MTSSSQLKYSCQMLIDFSKKRNKQEENTYFLAAGVNQITVTLQKITVSSSTQVFPN